MGNGREKEGIWVQFFWMVIKQQIIKTLNILMSFDLGIQLLRK